MNLMKPEYKIGKHLLARAENYPASQFQPIVDHGVLLGFSRSDGGYDDARNAILMGWLIDVSGHQQTLQDDISNPNLDITPIRS